MTETSIAIIGIMLPLLGTTLGAAMVFFIKGKLRSGMKKALLGFASGVMIAASVWSLIIPAIDMTEANGGVGWIPAVVGFLLGIGFLLLLDSKIPHMHINSEEQEGRPSKAHRSFMLLFAVTLHNIPEGMAVGVVIAAMLNSESSISLAGVMALSIGIAIQNFPEGAIISTPLMDSGLSKKKAFGYGFLSGAVEPVAALLTIPLASLITPVLPYILTFAAGAMIYVVIEELLPETHEGDHSNIGAIGFAIGFALMMVLDVALG